MVMAPRFCVMRRVLFARTIQASKAPKMALPTPMDMAGYPNFQPKLPANPMKMTAEK